MTPRPATVVGDTVPDSFRGRAYAVFREACYLRDEDGHQLVLLAEDAPPAPHGINVPRKGDDFRDEIARDARAQLENGVLTVVGAMSTRSAWSLERACEYDGLLDPVTRGKTADVAAALETLGAELDRHERSQKGKHVRLAQTARRRVCSAMDRLSAAIAEGDGERIRELASGLVGFGPGLTPSGDDALVGLLAAQAALGSASPDVVEAVRESYGHTVEISWGFLEAATRSRFTAPVRALATAVCEGDAAGSRRLMGDCLAFGASSGADGVVGLLGGFKADPEIRRELQGA
jgi:hypothetical protein